MRYEVPALASHIRKLKETRERKKAAITAFRSKLYKLFDEERHIWLSFIHVIAQLDCLLSLAKASGALGQPSCRPIVVDSEIAFVDFEQLRHPSVVLRRDFIPNDVALGSRESRRVILLTGEQKCILYTTLMITDQGPNMG